MAQATFPVPLAGQMVPFIEGLRLFLLDLGYTPTSAARQSTCPCRACCGLWARKPLRWRCTIAIVLSSLKIRMTAIFS